MADRISVVYTSFSYKNKLSKNTQAEIKNKLSKKKPQFIISVFYWIVNNNSNNNSNNGLYLEKN